MLPSPAAGETRTPGEYCSVSQSYCPSVDKAFRLLEILIYVTIYWGKY